MRLETLAIYARDFMTKVGPDTEVDICFCDETDTRHDRRLQDVVYSAKTKRICLVGCKEKNDDDNAKGEGGT